MTAPAAAPVPADDLPGRLGIVIQRLAHAARVRAKRGDLTPSRLAVLAILSSSGPLPVKDLAARTAKAMPIWQTTMPSQLRGCPPREPAPAHGQGGWRRYPPALASSVPPSRSRLPGSDSILRPSQHPAGTLIPP